MLRFFSTACAAVALAAITSSAAATAIWVGDTTGGPVFQRPAGFTSLSGVGTAVPYQVQPFHVSAAGQYIFEADSTSPFTHTDQYILVYANAFDASSPLSNLIAGDDDYSGPYTVLPGSSPSAVEGARIALGDGSNFGGAGTGLFLSPGTQYYAVVTGFGNTDFGTYQAGIGGGPGSVTLGIVPEPGSLAALALIGVAAGIRRRRA